MAAPMDSDEEDAFVSLGTPLEIFDDDEARKKPVSVHDLPATDSRGRPRFHGAFTGGFSAGYFNTVGTKEGFKPSAFISSRSTKGENVSQRPEDFMDDEDFGEHGIAPRKLATSSMYTSEERSRKRKAFAVAAAGTSAIPGVEALTDLIVPESLPVGVRLLRKMGWKEGQGIGPRERRARRKKKQQQKKTDPVVRVIGCALPPSGSDDDESEDENLQNITFAPKDKTPISFNAKDNTHGLGYHGLDPRSALPSNHINLFGPPPVKSKGHKGIKGHAFGVGALEEDDDDIYTVDHLSNYDMTMDFDEKDNNFGWTAPGQHAKAKQQIPLGYVGKLLEGFTLSSKPLQAKKVFKPPKLPTVFRPIHRFVRPCDSSVPQPSVKDQQNAVSRGLALGETPIFNSVFDLVSKDDQKKLQSSREAPHSSTIYAISGSEDKPRKSRVSSAKGSRFSDNLSHQDVDPSPSSLTQDSHAAMETGAPSAFSSSPSSKIRDTTPPSSDNTEARSSQPLFQGDLSFQPFAKDPGKQQRYNKYLSLVKQGNKDPYLEVVEGHMTEWEREREKEEFAKAAKLYKPLSAMMATRFTTAKYADDLDKVEVPADSGGEKSEQEKAAEMKMFGQLTRDEFEWHPDKLLCRRFNVPHPYPGSTIIGLPTVKRDKYSVFNFLEFPGTQSSRDPAPANQDQPKAIEYKDTTHVQAPEKPSMKSFTIGSKSAVKPALSSIFSVLYEDDEKQKKAKQAHLQQERIVENEEDTTAPGITDKPEEKTDEVDKKDEDEDTPSMDLFKAIFKNSDSEDSSSDSESDEDPGTKMIKNDENSKSNSSKQLLGSGEGEDKAIYERDEAVRAGQHLPVSSQLEVETLSQRLSPAVGGKDEAAGDGDDLSYGPALPPSGSVSSTTRPLPPVINLAHDSKWKQKHRFKDKDRDRSEKKHKHKKEKKAKQKKSKHKKKERKRKKNRRQDTSSDDADDSESSNDNEKSGPTDKELTEKLRVVGGGRLRAADFM